MKTRLVSMTYRGSASVDPRYSAAMLPWTINDIRSMENYTKLSVGIENGILEAYNSDFELQFGHPLKHIVGMCRIIHKPNGKNTSNGFLQLKTNFLTSNNNNNNNNNNTQQTALSGSNHTGFRHTLTSSTSYGSLSASAAAAYQNAYRAGCEAQGSTTQTQTSSNANNLMDFAGPITGLVYLMKDPRDPLLHIHLFECDAVEEMAELMHQMRDPAHTLGGSVGSIPQTLVSTNSNSSSDLSMQKALTSNGIQSTPATNLKLIEATRNAQHDASPNLVSSKMKSSKSYTHGLSNSAGTVNNIPTSSSAQSNLSLVADISPNHTHFFEVLYVGKIRVSHKRVPFSFIDDALPKFKAYDAQRLRVLQLNSGRRMSGSSESGGSSLNLKNRENDVEEEEEDENEHVKSDKEDVESQVTSDQEHQEQEIKKIDKHIEADRVESENSETESSKAKSSDELPKLPIEPCVSSGDEVAPDTEDDMKSEKATSNGNNKENRSPKRLIRGMSQFELPVQKDEVKTTSASAEGPAETGTKDKKVINSTVAPSKPNVIVNKHPSPPRQEQQLSPQQLQQKHQQQQQQQQQQLLHPNYALDNIPRQRDRSASYGCIPPYVEQNRTMVFLVGRGDLRLISPDRKQVLLYKEFKDVASCAQGQKNADHFGIICRDSNNDGYIGYVFKCQSDHVCDDIVSAISQAFVTCAEQKKKESKQIFSCEHCPMLWYHKLCTDVEGLSEKKTQAMIFRRIESLSDDEQDMIWAKFYGSEKMSSPLSEQNQFLMMLLRAHCESRQQRHVHDTAENRSEFLNQYLGGSTIFMKAKRSLTNSFDHLLKRKASKDDIVIPHSLRDQHIRESSAEPQSSGSGNGAGGRVKDEEDSRIRGNGFGSVSPSKPPAPDQLKSPMMDIFIKVGNSPKEAETHQGSWRQAILNSVVTPSKGMENGLQNEFLSPMRITQQKEGKRTREELRDLWKTAIRQTILLNRMEKENAMLQARQNENELKRIKLDYEEIVPSDKTLVERWEMIIERDSMKIGNKKDPKVLAQAIKTGVPRSKRGDVWLFLAEQHSMKTAPVDTKKFPNFNTPYDTLLKDLTEHQHAIFIDLGRTFPNHQFYKDPLGVGQLSLFNLLKAYSILDPELGYCQGLGFICGILLLHCDEANAFHLLKHLMFCRQMRTKYLPDMKKFQLELYQLSRLVKDHLPDLYVWLDQNDVSPTLYAAPWILTVFSSQFPLGFVARVFDLLFLESSEVIFKFAIALLTVHKDEILARDNFEEIMDYLKTMVPKIESNTMEKIMRMVFSLDFTKQLAEYNVEYNVLQEEISTTNHHLDMLNREKAQNQHLEQQLQFAQSSIAQLEKTRSSQQTQITALQTQVQTMETTIQALGRFVAQVAEQNPEMEMPGDLRRILQQLDDLERQRRKPLFTERKIGKSVSVNSHLGFHLKVLEELNEKDEHGSPQKKKTEKTPFFEHTYEQLRQQQQQRKTKNISTTMLTQKHQHHSLDLTSNCNNNNLDAGSSTGLQQSSQTTTATAQQQQRPNCLIDTDIQSKFDDLRLPENVDRYVSSIKSPAEVDSGVGTPLSPPSTSSNYSNSSNASSNMNTNGGLFSRMGYKTTPAVLSPLSTRATYATTTITTSTNANANANTNTKPATVTTISPKITVEEMHPLSMVGDVNVHFNGTTQLKSIRPVHHMRTTTTTTTTTNSKNIEKTLVKQGLDTAAAAAVTITEDSAANSNRS